MRKLFALILVALLSWSVVAQIGEEQSSQGRLNCTRTSGGGVFPGTDTILDDFTRANADPLDGSWTQGFQGTLTGT